jgi:hypothetical protein
MYRTGGLKKLSKVVGGNLEARQKIHHKFCNIYQYQSCPFPALLLADTSDIHIANTDVAHIVLPFIS